MDKVDWSKAPEWATSLAKPEWSKRMVWLGANEYRYTEGYQEDCQFKVEDKRFSIIEMRPDNWKEGEKRMEQIAQNGNGGEVYDETEDGKLSAYHRKVKGVWIDFYDIANAFDPENRNSADDHALKKMLLPGKRHTKGGIQDRKEAIQSIERAIELENDK